MKRTDTNVNGKTPPKVKIHVLLARESPMAVVIRRGPAKQTAVLGWNRRTDSFEVAQWLKGRIYHYRSDISPDGKHWIYFAIKEGQTWTVVAKTPWLKALDFYPKDDAWDGGGLFVSDAAYWLNDRYFANTPEQRKTSQLKVVTGKGPYPPVIGNSECLGIYFRRLLRDGWIISDTKQDGHEKMWAFRKSLNASWTLVKFFYTTLKEHKDKGIYYEEHALVNMATGEVFSHEDWEWADVDGKRLVWAEKGFIRCAEMTETGLAEPRNLFDCNPLTFEAHRAPY